DASGRPGVGAALVATWCHTGKGEGRPTHQAGHSIHLAHVVQCVATHAIGVALPRLEDLWAFNVLAIGGRQPEVASDGLESMAGQVARREIVAPNGVECVDALPARDRVAAGLLVLGAVVLTRLGASRTVPACRAPAGQAWCARASEGERHTQQLS